MRIGIMGVSGYGGGEALRICACHPHFNVAYVGGESSAGQKLGERFRGIGQLAELTINKWNLQQIAELDVLIASLPTNQSREPLAEVPDNVKIVDIGGDHRYVDGWTYGLADVWPERIREATRVANPGCYPSATILALAPLLKAGLILPTGIIVDAKSGVSGAGRGGGTTLGFAEVNEDVSAYTLFAHGHTPEMRSALGEIAGQQADLLFTPHLIPMTRGILATCYATTASDVTTEQCLHAAREMYAASPFVHVSEQPPHTKWATGSNMAIVSYAASEGRVIALGAVDNLGKGAAGQAIQNANLMCGLPPETGLTGLPIWP